LKLPKQGLPFSRDEKFFSATVFPSIVCRDNFRYLSKFLELIPGAPNPAIIGIPGITNIQFYTEYDVVKARFAYAGSLFQNPPDVSDVPDVIFLINSDPRVIVGIEAKMFNATPEPALAKQLGTQRHLLSYLAKETRSHLLHIALLPQSLAASYLSLLSSHIVVTWENIVHTFLPLLPNDYFVEVLRHALCHYEEYKGSAQSWGKNKDGNLSGLNIYKQAKAGTCEYRAMGRDRGRWGEALRNDIATGKWARFPYEVRFSADLPNSRWFLTDEFIELVDRQWVDCFGLHALEPVEVASVAKFAEKLRKQREMGGSGGKGFS
jgi:hypothetical protein